MSEWWDEWKPVIIVLAVLVVLLIMLFYIVQWVDYKGCMHILEIANHTGKWDFWSGCYVKIGPDLVPLDAWRVITP